MDVFKSPLKSLFSLFLFIVFGVFLLVIRTSKNTFYYNPNSVEFRNQHKKVQKNAYLVDTTNCRIVRWPTFDDQTRPLYVNKSGIEIKCNFNETNEISIERFNFTAIRVINKSNKKIECFKSEVRRKDGTDSKILYSPFIPFDPSIVQYFPSNTSVVKVSCSINGDQKYEKVIPLIPQMVTDSPPDRNLPNILFVGIDSVSRLNFDRHFPLSAKLLSKHNFYTMYGYNKVADNTFPNLTPLLTGVYLEDIWNETISKTAFLNYFPFIWKDFKNKGFQTLLIEDAPEIATFNYLKKGFRESPTDYYLRPFSLAIKDNITDDCYLNKSEIEIYYEYVYDFIKAMQTRTQKYFAFTFMARLAHDDLNNAGKVDPLVARLLTKLFDDNLMSDTLVVFFSDHGIRFGPIRQTLSGKIEERMPFMHLYVPNKWQNNNISINENRLTTPFDIHATLKHIVDGKPDHRLPYGKSLLEEIPENRSCDSIPILEHWCSCQSSEPIIDLYKMNPISLFIVESVNQLIKKANFREECSKLTLKRTVSAFEQHLSETVLKFKHSYNDVIDRHVSFGKTTNETIKHFLVTIKVNPSDALFEATVNLNANTHKMQIIGEVSRINFYGNQSNCIDNQFIRRYCFCRDFL